MSKKYSSVRALNLLLPQMHSLPEQVKDICQKLNAPPRLVAHLTLVYDVAVNLVAEIEQVFPNILFDKESVLFGAATHDIGKSLHRTELTEPGSEHEAIGEQMLLKVGIEKNVARFARTHAAWKFDKTLPIEDLFVSLADNIWKGKRISELETLIANRIASETNRETWDVFISLDNILQELAKDAGARLSWQAQFPV